MGNERSRRALVLSGGGHHGAFQAGALSVLAEEHGMDWQVVLGVSIGAMHAGFVSQWRYGRIAEAMEPLRELWFSLKDEDIRKNWNCFGKYAGLWKPSLYDSSPLNELIHRKIDLERIRRSGRSVRVAATSWTTGRTVHVNANSPRFLDWICASAAYPVIFTPVNIDGEMWGDAGMHEVTPVAQAIALGADHIDVIMCSSGKRGEDSWSGKSAVLDYMPRALSIMNDEIIENDLKVVGLKNDLAVIDPKYRHVTFRVIRPMASLPGTSLDFDPEAAKQKYDIGRRAARDVMSVDSLLNGV